MMNESRDPDPLSPTEFFNTYWTELDQRGWSSAILHTWEELPEQIHSDVDYLIGQVGSKELILFLQSFCQRNGWILAQVMEHEPGSFYCVCFMTKPLWSALKLDVAWDYCRKGRLLLPGDFLLRNRAIPEGKSFHVPTPKAEFAYVLAKGLAKSKGPEPVMARLEELWSQDREGCAGALVDYFGIRSHGLSEIFPTEPLCQALHPDASRFDHWRARSWGLQQFCWLFRRLRQPYGLSVAVNPRIDRARLAEILLPAFRRCHVIEAGKKPNYWQRLKMTYRSGLVILASDPATSLASDIFDARDQDSLDIVVAGTLRSLSNRSDWRNGSDA